MKQAVIVSACRTPIGKFQGGLAGFTAPQLGAMAVKEALSRAGIRGDQVDEVIMGNVLQAGLGQNPARQAALHGGVPDSVGAFTVNKRPLEQFFSRLRSQIIARQALQVTDNEGAFDLKVIRP